MSAARCCCRLSAAKSVHSRMSPCCLLDHSCWSTALSARPAGLLSPAPLASASRSSATASAAAFSSFSRPRCMNFRPITRLLSTGLPPDMAGRYRGRSSWLRQAVWGQERRSGQRQQRWRRLAAECWHAPEAVAVDVRAPETFHMSSTQQGGLHLPVQGAGAALDAWGLFGGQQVSSTDSPTCQMHQKHACGGSGPSPPLHCRLRGEQDSRWARWARSRAAAPSGVRIEEY